MVKNYNALIFRKTRKLDILGRACPKFEPNWSFWDKNTRVGPRMMACFWSLDQLVVETLGVASVRTSVSSYVCTCATLFLGNRSLLFSETLQLVRACRCEKNVPSAFLKISTVLAILAKLSKWPFLA